MASSVASGGMRMTMAERVEQAVRWDRWDDWGSFLSIVGCFILFGVGIAGAFPPQVNIAFETLPYNYTYA
jgi:hypothetical protein